MFDLGRVATTADDGADDGAAPVLGGGAPPSSNPNKFAKGEGGKGGGPFDMPDEEQFLKDGEANVQWWKETVAQMMSEGDDFRCKAIVLGSVEAVFPRFRDKLGEAAVEAAQVDGAWVVPPFILKDVKEDAVARIRWHDAKKRLGPFLKNDNWRRINAEVAQGLPVDWRKMGLMATNVVVVKQRFSWRAMAMSSAASAREEATWDNAKALARRAYEGATRDRLWSLLVSSWPLRWGWLVAWLLVDVAVWSSYKLTSDVLPISWHDVVMFWMANAMGLGYAFKHRKEADAALSDGASFKTAGSVALRKGKLDVAIEQYLEGEKCAAKLEGMWQLNEAFKSRAPPLRIACLNNAALTRLKQKEWEKAAALCERVLALEPSDPIARAKTLFRYAVGKAKLGEEGAARDALLWAHKLVPDDSEVEGMLRVLEEAARRRRAREHQQAEDAEADAMDAALAAMVDPKQPSDVSGYAALASRPPAAATAAAAETAAPAATSTAASSSSSSPVAAGKKREKKEEKEEEEPRQQKKTPPAEAPKPPAPPPPVISPGAPPKKVNRFGWTKTNLLQPLIGLAVEDEDRLHCVAIDAVRSFTGEAYVERKVGARARLVRFYDLQFELEIKAKVGGRLYDGVMGWADVTSATEPKDWNEVSADFGKDGPPYGSEAQSTLIGLIGPLRMEPALKANGRLTQQIWLHLLGFRAAFDALTLEDPDEQAAAAEAASSAPAESL